MLKKPQTKISYQKRVQDWVVTCFGTEIAFNVKERCLRFLEEALELVQSLGITREQAMKMVDYVYNRDVGEPKQEVGGTSVTLAALCEACDIDQTHEAEKELTRVLGKVPEIRKKQAFKKGEGVVAVDCTD